MSTIIVYSQLLWMQKSLNSISASACPAYQRQYLAREWYRAKQFLLPVPTHRYTSHALHRCTVFVRFRRIPVLSSVVSFCARSTTLIRSCRCRSISQMLRSRTTVYQPRRLPALLAAREPEAKEVVGQVVARTHQAVHARDTIYCLNDREFLVGIIPSSRDSSHSGYSENFSMRESNTGWLLQIFSVLSTVGSLKSTQWSRDQIASNLSWATTFPNPRVCVSQLFLMVLSKQYFKCNSAPQKCFHFLNRSRFKIFSNIPFWILFLYKFRLTVSILYLHTPQIVCREKVQISHGPLSCCKESGRFCGPVVRVGVNLASVDEYDEQSRLQVGGSCSSRLALLRLAGLLIVFRINFKFSSTRITSNYFR